MGFDSLTESLLENCQHVVFTHQQVFDVFDFDGLARVTAEQNVVAFLELALAAGSVIEKFAATDSDNRPASRLFLRRVGQHDPTRRRFLARLALNNDSLANRLKTNAGLLFGGSRHDCRHLSQMREKRGFGRDACITSVGSNAIGELRQDGRFQRVASRRANRVPHLANCVPHLSAGFSDLREVPSVKVPPAARPAFWGEYLVRFFPPTIGAVGASFSKNAILSGFGHDPSFSTHTK